MDKNIIVKIILYLPPHLIYELYCTVKFIHSNYLIRRLVNHHLMMLSFFKLLDYVSCNGRCTLIGRDYKTKELYFYLEDREIEPTSNNVLVIENIEEEETHQFKYCCRPDKSITIIWSTYIDIYDECHTLEKYIVYGMEIKKNKIKFKVRKSLF